MLYFLLIALPLISASPGSYHYHAQAMGCRPGFQTYLRRGRLQFSPRVALPSFRTATFFGRNGLETSSSSSLVEQTKNLVSTVTSYLTTLSAQPTCTAPINKIIRDLNSPCLSNIDDGIENFQTITEIVETLDPIAVKFTSLENVKDTAEVLLQTAALMRLMVPLEEKMRLINHKCEDQDGALGSLGKLLSQLSNNRALAVQHGVREQLKKAGSVISTVAPFITGLRSSSARLEKICTEGELFSLASLKEFGDLTEQMADLFSNLGDEKTGETFRYGKLYIDRIMAELGKEEKRKQDLGLTDFDFGLGSPDCTKGDLAGSADALEDIARLVQDVGIETLKNQLGDIGGTLVFDFDDLTIQKQ